MHSADHGRGKGALLLILTGILWSSGGLFIKAIDLHPLAIASLRSAIACCFLWIYLRRPCFTGSFAQIGGAIAFAVTQILFVIATKWTTAANAIFLQYTAPVYVALFANWFLGERARSLDWLILGVVLVGMVLFFRDDLTILGFWGNLCAIASSVSFAWLFLFTRKQKEGSPLETALLGHLLAAAAGAPFLFRAMPSLADWGGFLFLGVFQVGVSFVFYSIAIREVKAVEAALILTLEPVLNPLWVALIIGEVPGPWAILGGCVVLVAVTARVLVTTPKADQAPY